MLRKKYRDYLWFVTVVVFIVCVVEGIIYYAAVDNTFLRLSLNIQNAIKAYKIDPDISQIDAIKFLHSHKNIFFTIVTYIYCIAVITAPFCTIGALIIFVRTPFSYLVGLVNRKKLTSFLIIGKGEDRDKFVQSLSKDCKVTLIEEEVLQRDMKNKLIEMGVSIIQKYPDVTYDTLLKKVHLDKFDHILLCDQNVYENYVYLKMINEIYEHESHFEDNLSRPSIYFTCNDPVFEKLMFKKDSESNMEFRNVQLLNVQKKAVENMFEKYPIFQQSNGENQATDDVHIGIVGFGEFGQRTLIEAMSLSVLSADSTILFDIFDKDMKDKIGIFLNNFHQDIVNGLSYKEIEIIEGEKIGQYSLTLPNKNVRSESSRMFEVDGEMEIRFWNIDAESLQFKRIISDCHAENSFTYFVVCTGSNHYKMGLLESIRRMNTGENSQEFTGQMIVCGQSPDLEPGMLFIDPDEDVYSYKAIRNEDIINQAKLFNYNYTCMQDTGKHLDSSLKNRENIEIEWEKLDLFHRESSIRQSMHQSTKRNYILAKEEFSDVTQSAVKEELEKIEHRRWSLFMISRGYKWDPIKDNAKQTHDCITNWEHLKKEQDAKILEYDFTPYVIILKENHKDS